MVGSARAEPPRVVFDFETGDLQGWRVVEGQFGDLVCRREFFFNRPTVPYNKQGQCYLSTLERDGRSTDPMVGAIESPVFVLRGETASLLVGGGSHADTYVALCTEDGREVLYARGKNDETLQRVGWDVGKLAGQRVFLRVVDRNTGGWGHVTFDDFTAEGEIDAQATLARSAAMEKQRLDTEAKRLAARGRALANPLVCAQPIVFVVRNQYKPDHHNTETMFQTAQINTASFVGGAAIKTVDLARGGEVKTLLVVPDGVARDLEVSFDGRKVLFAMRRNAADDYHLYEIGADGSGLRQLTRGEGLSDIDPIYLPDGRILFTSTRETKFCMCNRHVMGNLYVMHSTARESSRSGTTRCTRATRRCCPTDAWCTIAGNTSTVISATPRASGPSTPTAPTTRSTGATTRIRPARCSTPGRSPARNCCWPTSRPATTGRGARWP
jgi:hypothetical protein